MPGAFSHLNLEHARCLYRISREDFIQLSWHQRLANLSYSTSVAKLIADQLLRFVTINRHQLAGRVGNFDFWLEEVRHALEVIDGYGEGVVNWRYW